MRLCYTESVVPEKPFIEKVSDVNISPSMIMNTVSEYYFITREEITIRSRKPEFLYPRQVCSYLMKKHLKMSLKQIAFCIKRDHSTAHHSIVSISNLIDTDYSTTRADIKAIEKILGV